MYRNRELDGEMALETKRSCEHFHCYSIVKRLSHFLTNTKNSQLYERAMSHAFHLGEDFLLDLLLLSEPDPLPLSLPPPPLLENLCERVILDSRTTGPKGTALDALLDFDLEEELDDLLLEELDFPPLLEELDFPPLLEELDFPLPLFEELGFPLPLLEELGFPLSLLEEFLAGGDLER